MKKTIFIACFLVIFSLVISGCNIVDKSSTQQVKENDAEKSSTEQIKEIKVDKNYLLALRTADNFLLAWLNRDYKKGVELLSEKVKNSDNQEGLFMFFTGLSNPHHQGFEIVGKENINENTIRFQVWLYEYYTNETPPPTDRSAPYSLDIIKVNENSWLVNNLPSRIIN